MERVGERPVAEHAAEALMDVNRMCAAVELVLDNVEEVPQWLAVFERGADGLAETVSLIPLEPSAAW